MKKIILITALIASFIAAPAQQKKAAVKKAPAAAATKKPAPTANKAAAPAKKTAAPAKAKAKQPAKNTGGKQQKKGTPTNSSINNLRNEQAKIKQDIKRQEQALRANKAQVQQKMKDLERIAGDMHARQQSIDSIHTDINRIDNNIGLLSSQLDNLNAELQDRKARYVKSMRYMAKQRNVQSKLMFVFSAKNLAQVFRRMRFMRQYAAYQRSQGLAVQEMQEQVNNKRAQLNGQKTEKNTMLYKGQQEKQALAAQKTEQEKIVTSLQGQQKVIQSVIDEQKKKDAALNAQIDKLVAEEVERARQRAIAEAKRKADQAAAAKKRAEELARKKAEAEARARENERRIAEAKAAEEKAKAEARQAARDEAARRRAEQMAKEAEAARVAAERKAAADKARAEKEMASAKKASEEAAMLSSADRIVSGGFEANKGRLPSPLSGGRIVSHFGQHGVEGLPNVVLDNKGINILGGAGATVTSIYEGEVSAVFDVGGSRGVLVRHGAYISVYCNLRSVSVSRGQKVSARQALGTVGSDNILQFQLRKERAKLNPEQWLAR